MGWIKSRLKERSTWLGIVTLATIGGMALTPQQQELIVQGGMAIGALIMTFTADQQ